MKHKTQFWAKIISDFFQNISESSQENSLENLSENSVENVTANSFQSQFINTKKIDSFISKNKKYLYELLRFDFLRIVKPGSIPSWFERHYNKDKHHAALLAHSEIKSSREAYAYSDYDEFAINPLTFETESQSKNQPYKILFLYPKLQEKKASDTRRETKVKVEKSVD